MAVAPLSFFLVIALLIRITMYSPTIVAGPRPRAKKKGAGSRSVAPVCVHLITPRV